MVIGHEKISRYLAGIIKKDTPVHAYLFHGPKSVGKATAAKWFAKSLICNRDDTKPCNACVSCIAYNKGLHPDVHCIHKKDDKTGITIEQIRELRSKIFQTPLYNSYRIALVDNPHECRNEASNAFLKILEEPPKKTVIILTTHLPKLLLPTIRSRTEQLRFSLVSEENIKNALPESFNDEQKQFISRISQGRIGEALRHTKESVQETVDRETEILSMLKKPLHSRIAHIEEYTKKKDAEMFEHDVQSLIRDIMLVKNGSQNLITHIYLKDEFQKLASRYSGELIKQTLDDLLNAFKNRGINVNRQLLWQNIFLNW